MNCPHCDSTKTSFGTHPSIQLYDKMGQWGPCGSPQGFIYIVFCHDCKKLSGVPHA